MDQRVSFITLVVTDNYLKLRVPAGHARNERVQVRLLSAATGVVVDPRCR